MNLSSDARNSNDSVSPAAAGLKLYDTASKAVSAFVPIEPGKVGIYVCGATVQASPHVGHVRTTLAFDVIRRWMTKLGYDVTLIRNVTDIDDKILSKAADAGQQWWERAFIYEREFTKAYDQLGALPPTYEPRATGHIPQMIDLVMRLIDRGHAYIVPDAEGNPSGNVYYDVESWPEYGALTHQESGTQAADEQAAVADQMGPSVDAQGEDKYNPAGEDDLDAASVKRGPRDFALWKASKPTDPITARWVTPFGTGRPGWHLECSAMSRRYLGADFDIHGGGLDLRFPHHENEMAQSHAAGWGFAHRWMHTAWVTQKGEKMSKSLGNGLAVSTVLDTYPAWVVRYALVSAHYRSMLEWSDQSLHEAQSAYERITGFVERAGKALGWQPSREEVAALPVELLPADFVAAMNNDISVSEALAVVFARIRQANANMSEGSSNDGQNQLLKDLLAVRAMLDVFGLDPLDPHWAQPGQGQQSSAAHDALESLVSQELANRQSARANKDFAQADAIRDRLAQANIIIEDTPQGPAWHLES
ncbi:cysteine--tRNA ligase [Bombiscardovia apis]|uniref:Cysteine--tRNA ligase n=1 Tax=Bombiscardovia apis TaxID=2932182 RepID=A0ABN6SDS2_9BIFI|nr:cysteine--tRNA ligase [Bombiscardovia apis]BDR54194.1 cysteine--tRNA ligase [Bombiscardovia apis]